RYAMANPRFVEFVDTTRHRLAPPWDYDLVNGNSFLASYPGADGVKMGWTERAGWTLVASATRDGHRLFAVVLNSADRDADAATLLNWAFGSFRWLPLSKRTDAAMKLAERLGIGGAFTRSLAACS